MRIQLLVSAEREGGAERGRERERDERVREGGGNRRMIQLSNAILSKLISLLTKPHFFCWRIYSNANAVLFVSMANGVVSFLFLDVFVVH